MTNPLRYSQIAVINTKGGVGKTTLVMLLAHALIAHGKKVVVYDTDADGSAYAWAQYAQAAGTPLPFEVVDGTSLGRAITPDLDYILIDTPANNLRQIERLVEESNYLIIPVQTGTLELDRLTLTMEKVINTEKRPDGQLAGFVLNNMTPRANITKGTLEQLEEGSVSVIGTLNRRVSYQACFGRVMSGSMLEPGLEILRNLDILETPELSQPSEAQVAVKPKKAAKKAKKRSQAKTLTVPS